MKKFILLAAVLTLGFMAGVSRAGEDATGDLSKTSMGYAYAGNLALNTGLAYNQTYLLDLDYYKATRAALTVTYSSGSYSSVAFSTNAIAMGSANITAAAHGFPLGLPVLLKATAGTVPGPLTAETTYYAIPASANIVQLATTSAQAVAGDPIVLVSSTNTGTQTYTLAPLAIAGSPVFAFKASNDNSAFVDLAVSSATTGHYVAGGLTFGRDLGEFNYRYLRMDVTAPTAGALNIKAVVHTKP
jgi:hypothetical protein